MKQKQQVRIVEGKERSLQYILTIKSVKNLNMRVKPNGEIHVSANRFVPMKYIDNFGEIEPNYFAPMETWVDYTFDISPDEIESCRLYGEFRTHKNYTEGNWEVTFRLP